MFISASGALGRNGFATEFLQQQVGVIYTPSRQKGGIVAALLKEAQSLLLDILMEGFDQRTQSFPSKENEMPFI